MLIFKHFFCIAASDEKHKKDRHKRDRSHERSRDSRTKHRDTSREKKRRSRSRRRDSSKDRHSTESKKSRPRSTSRHKSAERNKSRHRDKRDEKYKSRHSRRKDSESDTSVSATVKPFTTKTEDILATMGLDKKSKEILESLVDNKVVDDRILKDVDETISMMQNKKPVTMTSLDSESDHEPSSTVNIATPPRNSDRDTTPPLPDKSVVLTPPLESGKFNNIKFCCLLGKL